MSLLAGYLAFPEWTKYKSKILKVYNLNMQITYDFVHIIYTWAIYVVSKYILLCNFSRYCLLQLTVKPVKPAFSL